METAIIIMGVSGSGKTSVGQALSASTGWSFYDGDDFHSQANIDKMAKGIPLNDTDRLPWLKALHNLIAEHLSAGRSMILACSALKAEYRKTLRGNCKGVRFVYLEGSFDLIFERMKHRSGHYMKAEMLRSQFETLEYPEGAFAVSIEQPVNKIVEKIVDDIVN